MSENPPPDLHNALPAGLHLGEFEIRRVLGSGGFGIVYVAFDRALEREVAIKEYMPAALAGRSATHHVTVLSRSHAESFALGLRSFVNEARLLARFDHPCLVKVLRFWEELGTAYMAMPLYKGSTLKALRQGMSAAPDEAWLRRVCEGLLGALELMHREGVYHRDISPDNIVTDEEGRPVLLDFGAARRVLNDRSQALTAILKPNYAPIEQYAEAAGLRQGPWTDLYALGATLHFLVTGQPPAPATARALADERVPLQHQSLPGLSHDFLALVDWLLAPRPDDRPRDVAQVRAALAGRLDIPPTPLPKRVAEAADDKEWPATEVFERTLPPAARVVPPVEPQDDPDATIVRPTNWRPTALGPVPPSALSPLLMPSTAPAPSEPPATAVPRAAPQAPPPLPAYPTPQSLLSRPEPSRHESEPPAAPVSEPAPEPAPAPRRPALVWLAGGTLLVAAVAVYLLSGRAKAPDSVPPMLGSAASAASAVALPARSASAASGLAEAPGGITVIGAPPALSAAASVAASAPEPAQAAAPVAPSVETQAASLQPRPPAASSAGVVATRPAPVAKPPRGVVQRPQPASASAPVANAAPAAVPATAEVPPTAPPAMVAAPAAPAEPVHQDPNAACAGRMLVALHRCLLRECAKPEYTQNATCTRVRDIERRAQELQTQY